APPPFGSPPGPADCMRNSWISPTTAPAWAPLLSWSTASSYPKPSRYFRVPPSVSVSAHSAKKSLTCLKSGQFVGDGTWNSSLSSFHPFRPKSNRASFNPPAPYAPRPAPLRMSPLVPPNIESQGTPLLRAFLMLSNKSRIAWSIALSILSKGSYRDSPAGSVNASGMFPSHRYTFTSPAANPSGSRSRARPRVGLTSRYRAPSSRAPGPPRSPAQRYVHPYAVPPVRTVQSPSRTVTPPYGSYR